MEQALTFVAGAALGAVITVLGTYLVLRFQRTRKRLGYEVVSAARLVLFEPTPEDPLQIMVRRDLLEDDPARLGEYIPVGTVWGFRVTLRNSGDTPIENQEVLIALASEARVISAGVEASDVTTSRHISVESRYRALNMVRVTFPHLNEREELVVGIRTVSNRTGQCRVIATAPGLESYDMFTRRESLRRRTMFIAIFSPAPIVLVAFTIMRAVAPDEWQMDLFGLLAFFALATSIIAVVSYIIRIVRPDWFDW